MKKFTFCVFWSAVYGIMFGLLYN